MTDRGINKVVKVLAVLILLPLAIIIPTLSIEGYYAPLISAQAASEDKSFAERKKQYNAQLDQEVNEAEKQRIQLRCLATQTTIENLATRIGEVKTQRKTVYSTIVADVQKLTEGLNNQAFDASALEQNTKELEDKITAYENNMKVYTQALEDLTKIDCSKDPGTFKAALEAARRAHTNLIGQVAEIRSYILNTLKPTMQQVKEELIAQQAAGEVQ